MINFVFATEENIHICVNGRVMTMAEYVRPPQPKPGERLVTRVEQVPVSLRLPALELVVGPVSIGYDIYAADDDDEQDDDTDDEVIAMPGPIAPGPLGSGPRDLSGTSINMLAELNFIACEELRTLPTPTRMAVVNGWKAVYESGNNHVGYAKP